MRHMLITALAAAAIWVVIHSFAPNVEATNCVGIPGWTCVPNGRCDNQFNECAPATPAGTACDYCDGGAIRVCKRAAAPGCVGAFFPIGGACGTNWHGACAGGGGRCAGAVPNNPQCQLSGC